MKPLLGPAAPVWLLALFASAALCPGTVAAASPSVCTRLVSRMRRSVATVVKDQAMSAWQMQPWITDPIVHLPQDTRVYRRIAALWRAQLPLRRGEFSAPLTSVEALQGTDLFVANQIEGSGDCLASTFIEWKWGATPRVIAGAPLPPTMGPCARGNVWARSAIVLGRPAYVASTFPDPANADVLLYVTTWNGKKWSRPCPVSIRYTYRYEVRRLFCAGGHGLCRAAGAIAPEVRRRYTVYSTNLISAFNGGAPLPKFHFPGGLNGQERALVARARRVGLPTAIAPGRRLHPSWLQHLSTYGSEYFALRLEGKVYVGVATRSARNRRTAYLKHHWLFIVFRAPTASSARLHALAVFTVQRVTSGIQSIQARAPG